MSRPILALSLTLAASLPGCLGGGCDKEGGFVSSLIEAGKSAQKMSDLQQIVNPERLEMLLKATPKRDPYDLSVSSLGRTELFSVETLTGRMPLPSPTHTQLEMIQARRVGLAVGVGRDLEGPVIMWGGDSGDSTMLVASSAAAPKVSASARVLAPHVVLIGASELTGEGDMTAVAPSFATPNLIADLRWISKAPVAEQPLIGLSGGALAAVLVKRSRLLYTADDGIYNFVVTQEAQPGQAANLELAWNNFDRSGGTTRSKVYERLTTVREGDTVTVRFSFSRQEKSGLTFE